MALTAMREQHRRARRLVERLVDAAWTFWEDCRTPLTGLRAELDRYRAERRKG